MKGLILCAGKGTRLRPFTHSQPKQLIPVGNKPIIYYGIETLQKAGITEIGIVVGNTKKEMMRALGNGSEWGMSFTYIVQDTPGGLAHAVKVAQPFLKDSPFVLYLGDNLFEDSLKPFMDFFMKEQPDALLGLKRVTDPRKFGVAEVDKKEKSVINVLEKPEYPPTNFAITGVYIFSSVIFEEIDKLQPSKRDELEITDAISGLISRGNNVKYIEISGWWKDTGNVEEILSVNRQLLERTQPINQGELDTETKIVGSVNIGKGSTVISSTIIGPTMIGNECRILNAVIGPYTSLGNNVEVVDCALMGSLIMDNACLEGGGSTFRDSLMGRNVYIKKASHNPTMKFIIGDDNRVVLRK